MNDQDPPETAKREHPPFQFGMKYLMAAPLAVALFFAIAAYLGPEWAAFILWILLMVSCIAGTCCSTTRRISIGGFALLVLVPLLLPLYNPAFQAKHRAQCNNNLKQIALALHCYHDTYGYLPPAYIADENGRPMHSWRVLILPYMEHQTLYDQYDFNEPWDGPNNSKLADTPISAFTCPADSKHPSTITSYLAVIGPNTAWPENQPTRFGDFTDGSSNTLLLVESANSGIHWMEPRDLHVGQMAPTINPAARQGISSLHPGGANAAVADGSVRFLPDTVLPEDLRAILTRSGSESIDIDEVVNRRAD